ncbi:MAG: hypothetical protein HY692_08430 [Cyanobacteria bacterium NC_groundwater_1444_Ag_S-0.65um_54_12]|nr:hypothetical protein [Cyanobacteria bacterium NC_groundwater_1444_Ag_S-0.65um_54_12]
MVSVNKHPVKQTPYQQLRNSAVGQFARDHKLVTGVAAAATTAAVASITELSREFDKVTERALLPGVGMALGAVGGMMVHDAIVNDRKDQKLRATGKAAAGTLMAMTGASLVGNSYGIPVLKDALKPVKILGDAVRGNLSNRGQTGVGLGVMVASIGLLDIAIKDGRKNGFGEKQLVSMATGAAGGFLGASIYGKEINPKLAAHYERGATLIAGAGLGALAVTRGKAAFDGLRENSMTKTVGNSAISLVAGGGGAVLLGNALGLPVLTRTGEKLFHAIDMKVITPAFNYCVTNPIATLGGVAAGMAAIGTAAYLYSRRDKKD